MKVSRRRFLAGAAGVAVAASAGLRAGAGERTLEVICREAWGARKPRRKDFERHVIERLTVHHSATVLRDNRKAPARFRAHQRAHMARGWPDIAYHLLVDRNGHVYEGRPRWAPGDTATNYDPEGHLQVMCEGNFEEQRPTGSTLDALADVLAWAVRRYDAPVKTIHGHRDYADTACPGDELYRRLTAVRRMVRARLDEGGVRFVELCGPEAEDLIADIEAGRA